MSNRPPEAHPLFVVMLGGIGGDGLEGLMRRALEASALDLLEAAGGTGRFADCVLVSDRAPGGELPNGARLVLDDVLQPFHFGRRVPVSRRSMRQNGV